MAINCPVTTDIQRDIRQTAQPTRGASRSFSADFYDKLQRIMYTKRAEAGTYLFWEGDEAGKLYYIRSGRVKLRKSTEDGKDILLSIHQQGDLLGEAGGCTIPHSFSAEVIETAEIGVLQWDDLEALLSENGNLALQFVKWMGLNQRIAQSKFRDLLLFGKPGALASTLIRISNTYGVLRSDGILLDIKLTNTDLAELIGSTRESVNRMLCSLKDEGTIDIRQGKIMICRLSDLRRICNCPGSPACPKEVCQI